MLCTNTLTMKLIQAFEVMMVTKSSALTSLDPYGKSEINLVSAHHDSWRDLRSGPSLRWLPHCYTNAPTEIFVMTTEEEKRSVVSWNQVWNAKRDTGNNVLICNILRNVKYTVRRTWQHLKNMLLFSTWWVEQGRFPHNSELSLLTRTYWPLFNGLSDAYLWLLL